MRRACEGGIIASNTIRQSRCRSLAGVPSEKSGSVVHFATGVAAEFFYKTITWISGLELRTRESEVRISPGAPYSFSYLMQSLVSRTLLSPFYSLCVAESVLSAAPILDTLPAHSASCFADRCA